MVANPNSGLSIRRYRPEDNDAVWELHRVGLEKLRLFIDNPEYDKDLNNIEAVYLSGRGELLIGELVEDNHTTIVAMGAIKPIDATTAEIKRMRVLPEFQGRGFGQQIYEALEKRARELGYETLTLNTAERQPVARHLYEKNGYILTGTAMLADIPHVLYEKKL